ncbi:MAG: GTP-binding protein, partial [Planctomycetota bacterium]
PESESFRSELDKKWAPDVGDCRQELVFIGIGMDEIALYDSLQKCLLTEEELQLGIEQWKNFSDPFPKWNFSVEDALAARQQASKLSKRSSGKRAAIEFWPQVSSGRK